MFRGSVTGNTTAFGAVLPGSTPGPGARIYSPQNILLYCIPRSFLFGCIIQLPLMFVNHTRKRVDVKICPIWSEPLYTLILFFNLVVPGLKVLCACSKVTAAGCIGHLFGKVYKPIRKITAGICFCFSK